MRSAPPETRRPRLLSLFSGIGGLDAGLEASGFETIASVEQDEYARAELCRQRPDCRLVEELDVNLIEPGALRRQLGLRRGELELLAGGPPCQPFSRAAAWTRQRGLRDPRARTLSAFFSMVTEFAPAVVLLENVPTLATRHDSWLSKQLERVNTLLGTQYAFTVVSAQAADFGVPQTRQRTFLVAQREGLSFSAPAPTHGIARPFATAWDALANCSVSTDPQLRVTGKWAGLLETIPPGLNYLFHTDRGDGRPIFGWRRRYWSFLLKLDPSRPSWTVTASPGPANGPFHWENRRLSAVELAALQTYPLRAEPLVGLHAAQRLFGNAVPSLLAEVLGRELRRQFLGQRPIGPLKLAIESRSDRPTMPRLTRAPDEWLSKRTKRTPHPGEGRGDGARKLRAERRSRAR